MKSRMKTLPRHLAAGAAAALAAVACATPPPAGPPQEAQLARALSSPERLAPPEALPAQARALLHTRMASHAQDMGSLMSAIMVLRYQEIGTRARNITHEPDLVDRRVKGRAWLGLRPWGAGPRVSTGLGWRWRRGTADEVAVDHLDTQIAVALTLVF